MHACKMYAYEVHTYEVYTRDFDLSLTAPMSCCTGRHTTVLGGMRWCVMVPPNCSRRSGRGCSILGRRGMGYGTRPHDWKLDELESMKTLCLAVSLVYVTQPIVADQHECQTGVPY